MNEPDEIIYERFLAERNEEYLLMLLERHKEKLILFLNGFVGNIDTAEELALYAFAEVAAGPTLFRERSSFKTWLFSIGKNLALMYIRTQKRITAFTVGAEPQEESSGGSDGSLADEGVPDPEMIILREERNRQLYKAMGRISEEYWMVLLLLYFEEMTNEEAGQVMGKSRKQVYNLVERGKCALKEELLKMGFEYEIGL